MDEPMSELTNQEAWNLKSLQAEVYRRIRNATNIELQDRIARVETQKWCKLLLAELEREKDRRVAAGKWMSR